MNMVVNEFHLDKLRVILLIFPRPFLPFKQF
jgi:hypothetical protein